MNTAARTPRRLKQDTSGPYLGSESCKCSENIWILNQPRQRQDGKTNGQKSAGRMGVWGFISVLPVPRGEKAVLNLNHCLSERTQRFFSFFPFHSL